MTPSAMDLAFVADALLGLCARDPLAPFLTEEAWERRARQGARRESSLDASPSVELAAKAGSPLLAREVEDVLMAARLTRVQAEALDLRMMGHTFEEIGRERRTTKQASMKAFAQGLRKVAASLARYPYDGLSDAHAADVARRGHRRRR